ncbi:MAG: hypothetical protein AAFY41_15180, partial [Bacteroidota bacterium]
QNPQCYCGNGYYLETYNFSSFKLYQTVVFDQYKQVKKSSGTIKSINDNIFYFDVIKVKDSFLNREQSAPEDLFDFKVVQEKKKLRLMYENETILKSSKCLKEPPL